MNLFTSTVSPAIAAAGGGHSVSAVVQWETANSLATEFEAAVGQQVRAVRGP